MLDRKAFPRHEIHKPPFPNSTLNRKVGNISTDIRQTLYPPCEGLGSASGIHQQSHTRLEVSLMSLNPTSNALVGRGELLESTQEKGQKG